MITFILILLAWLAMSLFGFGHFNAYYRRFYNVELWQKDQRLPLIEYYRSWYYNTMFLSLLGGPVTTMVAIMYFSNEKWTLAIKV